MQIRAAVHILGSSPANSHALWISKQEGGREGVRDVSKKGRPWCDGW